MMLANQSISAVSIMPVLSAVQTMQTIPAISVVLHRNF